MLPNSIFSVPTNAKAIFEMLKMTDIYAFFMQFVVHAKHF